VADYKHERGTRQAVGRNWVRHTFVETMLSIAKLSNRHPFSKIGWEE
jgi:hypothetical protein